MEAVNTEQRRKCPQCFNYMSTRLERDGSHKGVCQVCKSHIQSKQQGDKVTLIKITKTSTNQAKQ